MPCLPLWRFLPDLSVTQKDAVCHYIFSTSAHLSYSSRNRIPDYPGQDESRGCQHEWRIWFCVLPVWDVIVILAINILSYFWNFYILLGGFYAALEVP